MKKHFLYLFWLLAGSHLNAAHKIAQMPTYSSEAPVFSSESPTIHPLSDLKKISKFCQVDLKMVLKGSPSLPLRKIINSDFHRDILLLPYARMEPGLKPLLIQHSKIETKKLLRNSLYKETRRPRPDPLSSFDKLHMRQSCCLESEYNTKIDIAQSLGILKLDGNLECDTAVLRAICAKDHPCIYRLEINCIRFEHLGYILRALINKNCNFQEISSRVSENINMHISQNGIQYTDDDMRTIESPIRGNYDLEQNLTDVLVSFLKNNTGHLGRLDYNFSILIRTDYFQEKRFLIRDILFLAESCFRSKHTPALFNPQVL